MIAWAVAYTILVTGLLLVQLRHRPVLLAPMIAAAAILCTAAWLQLTNFGIYRSAVTILRPMMAFVILSQAWLVRGR